MYSITLRMMLMMAWLTAWLAGCHYQHYQHHCQTHYYYYHCRHHYNYHYLNMYICCIMYQYSHADDHDVDDESQS